MFLRTLSIALVFLAGCGEAPSLGAAPDTNVPPEAREPLATPSLRLVSPPVLVAGGLVTVLGSGFVAPERGRTHLTFSGRFVTESGDSDRVEMEADATYVNPGKLQLVFEPALPPSGFGQDVGRFTGEVVAQNIGEDEASEPSAALDVGLDVGPSLIVWDFAPENERCASRRVAATLSGTTLEASIEATGLAAATSSAPLTVGASWVDLAGTPHTLEARLTSGRSANLSIDFGALPQGQVRAMGLVSLRAKDATGKELRRALSVEIDHELDVSYDGNVRIAELYAPVQVSSCLPGGAYGTNVSYSGGQSESRTRSVGFSASLSIELWIVSASFGVNVSESVSSSESESLSLSGQVLPHQFGVFYRQTQRLERLGQIVRHSACGEATVVGDARVTDWNWAPDLAVTTNGQCPPAPPSNLPPAQVFP